MSYFNALTTTSTTTTTAYGGGVRVSVAKT